MVAPSPKRQSVELRTLLSASNDWISDARKVGAKGKNPASSLRVQVVYEFETEEQAMAVCVNDMETSDAFLKLGTLDYEVSVHKLSREG